MVAAYRPRAQLPRKFNTRHWPSIQYFHASFGPTDNRLSFTMWAHSRAGSLGDMIESTDKSVDITLAGAVFEVSVTKAVAGA